MGTNWKQAERQTAKVLGGKRNSRGADFSKSAAEVEHALFSVECKYRKQLPKLLRQGLEQAQQYDRSKPPLLVVKEKGMHGALVVMKLGDFVDIVKPMRCEEEEG
jgi:hypothetical protein